MGPVIGVITRRMMNTPLLAMPPSSKPVNQPRSWLFQLCPSPVPQVSKNNTIPEKYTLYQMKTSTGVPVFEQASQQSGKTRNIADETSRRPRIKQTQQNNAPIQMCLTCMMQTPGVYVQDSTVASGH